MTVYYLYQTGIKVAIFKWNQEQKDFQIQLRNLKSGEFETEVTFDPIIHGQFLNEYIRTDFVSLLKNFDQYKVFVAENVGKMGEVVQTDWEQQFEISSENIWVGRHQQNPTDLLVEKDQLKGFYFTNREFTSVFVEQGYEPQTILKKWQEKKIFVENPAAVSFYGIEMVPIRDGIRLSTMIYLPNTGDSAVPVIFVRTPYGKENYGLAYFRFVQQGYGLVIQDTRGRNDSEGEFVYNACEQEDGEDALSWLSEQPWCNGMIGMIGASYGGYVQWSAAASGTPHLKAIVSTVTSGGPFSDVTRKGGAYSSGLAWWFAMSQKKFDRTLMLRNDWQELMKVRPLINIPEVGLGHQITAYNQVNKHQVYDDFFEKMDWPARKKNINVPALIISGWFDDNEAGSTEAIKTVSHYQNTASKVILGPWLHNGNSRRDLKGFHVGNDSLRYDIDLMHLLWFDRFLKEIPNKIDETKKVEFYSIHENGWKTANQWPIENSIEEEWFLQNKENDSLLLQTNERSQSFTFESDPGKPVPHLIEVSENELSFPNDYSEVEKRKDLALFTTPVLKEDKTVTGQISLSFYVKSDVVDADWVVRMTDVAPDGSSYQVAMTVVNAKFRNSWSEPELLIPGEIYRMTFELSKTSYCFKKGHQIRVQLANTAENYIFSNSQTKEGVQTIAYQKGTHEILSGSRYPAKLILPVEKK